MYAGNTGPVLLVDMPPGAIGAAQVSVQILAVQEKTSILVELLEDLLWWWARKNDWAGWVACALYCGYQEGSGCGNSGHTCVTWNLLKQ